MAPVGFLEEAPGTKSSTRLLAFILAACVVALVTFTGVYVLGRKGPDSAVVGALAGMVAALVANGIVAIVGRTRIGNGGDKGDGECH